MPDTPVIRQIQPADFDQVSRLTFAAYADLHKPDEMGSYADVLRDVAGRVRDAEVFIAVDGDQIIGAVTYVEDAASPMSEWDDREAAGIRMLAILPEAQGRGVGRALTKFTLERARQAGKARMVLHSSTLMHGAHRLYEGLGFARAPDLDFSVETGAKTGEKRVALLGYRLDF